MISKKFKKNDVICFMGDSITADGRWIAEIFDYFYINEREKKIKIINCGVSGDTSDRATYRLFSDCLKHFPNYVVIMFGMNDIERELYSKICKSDTQSKRAAKIDLYKNRIEYLIHKCKEIGVEVILCTPTPCDEVHDYPAERIMCNSGLLECSDIVLEMAKKYECSVVDFTELMIEEIKKSELISEDRVHPNNLGHHVMAQEFLKQLGIIEEADYTKKYICSAKNEERKKIEHIIRGIKFVEWSILFEEHKQDTTTLEEKKQIVRKRLEDDNGENPYISSMFSIYLECVDKKEYYMGELIKKICEMYIDC